MASRSLLVSLAEALTDAPTAGLDQPAPGFSDRILTAAMVVTWLSEPALQQRFDPMTPAGRRRLANWCRKQRWQYHDSKSRFRASADAMLRKIRPRIGQQPGASLVGYSRGVFGMGEHVRMSAMAMAAAQVPYGVVDFTLGLGDRFQPCAGQLNLEPHNRRRGTIMHINADQMVQAYWHLGPEFFRGHYVVGYWAWELASCPPAWRPIIGMVDEIWAPSAFVRDAFAPFTSKPVIAMPLCVELPAFERLPRSAFGFPDDEFLFAFSFDARSWTGRKNPIAAIRSFRRAFPDGQRARLVLKAMNGEAGDPQWDDFMREADGDERIVVINETWPREKLLQLLACADAYVSLHRSEGFGRTPAEAMLLGKPVIVTNYSGTREFCRETNSLLVDFRLVDVAPGDYPQADRQQWAEPDLDLASSHMRRLFEDADLAARLGEAGRATIERDFSARAIGARYRKRLDETGMLSERTSYERM